MLSSVFCYCDKSEFVHHVRECARRGYRGRPESPLNKSHSIRLFAGGLRKKVSVFSVGARPLLQGVPSFKQSTGLFEIHPLRSARSVRVFRRLRTAARAPPLTRKPFLGKGLTPNLFNMHDLAHYPCIAVGESSSGKYCFPFSLLSSQSFLLFGDLFPK